MQPIDLSIFPPEREQALRGVMRYGKFDVMYYRSSLWEHAQRVLWITEALIPIAKKYLDFDPEKARALALVHDDPEVITGDMPSDHKTKMSPEEAEAHEAEEKTAIDKLAERYPQEFHGYVYRDLLMHALKKDCPEAWLVSYADKLDAYGETTHDLLAGNYLLLWSLIFYTQTFLNFPKKFPGLAPLLESTESPFTDPKYKIPPTVFDTSSYKHMGQPYTQETLSIRTDFPLHNEWKKIILARGGEEGLEWLTKQKEFLK